VSKSHSILNVILNRSSIRRFKTQKISDKILNMLLQAGQRAPSACSLQTYSFIVVGDSAKRNKIGALCGQSFIHDAPVWIVVCADMNRLEKTLKVIGHENVLNHDSCATDKIYSIFDSALAAENIVLAAEALGLGSVFIGMLGTAEEVSKILKLPSRVLPVAMLCIGVPAETPPFRHRWSLEAIKHEDEYRQVSDKMISSYLEAANRDFQEENYYLKYFDQDYNHTEHIKQKTRYSDERKRRDGHILKFIEKVGFRI